MDYPFSYINIKNAFLYYKYKTIYEAHLVKIKYICCAYATSTYSWKYSVIRMIYFI